MKAAALYFALVLMTYELMVVVAAIQEGVLK